MTETVTPAALTVRPMDAWYAMNDESGRPQGYARLVIQCTSDGGTAVEWQLRLAFPQGTYEEDRTMTLDGQLRLVSASYFDGKVRCEGKRSGDNISVTMTDASHPGPPQFSTVPARADAWPGMDFALAGALPQREGVVLERTGLNEAQAFANLGPVKLQVMGRETITWRGKPLDVWRVERESTPRDTTVRLPIWVDDKGRIVQADWGGGNLMVLSPTPTAHLFKPAKPGQ